jgi:hypothetical protein
VIVWFGNIYGWLWILLSSGYDYTQGCDKKNSTILMYYIIVYLMCFYSNNVGGSVLHSSIMSKQASHDFMRSQFRSDIFEDNEMPPLKNYSDEDVEYPVDGRSLII